jgi:ketosteroid isomerase-like protein
MVGALVISSSRCVTLVAASTLKGLAPDFLCTLADGTLIDRDQFLANAATPTTAHGLQVHDVIVRVLGDAAIVHAATSFTHPDGRPGRGRYTDVWARRDGRWLAVAAQFMRQ